MTITEAELKKALKICEDWENGASGSFKGIYSLVDFACAFIPRVVTDLRESTKRAEKAEREHDEGMTGRIAPQDPLVLLESLLTLGPSHDGAVERDLRAAILRLINETAKLSALDQDSRRKLYVNSPPKPRSRRRDEGIEREDRASGVGFDRR